MNDGNGYRGALLIAAIIFAAASAYPVMSCGENPDSQRPDRPIYIATIPPLASILEEIVGERGDVYCLLQAGASPHTYDPTPADAVKVEKALAVFRVHQATDGWAASLQNPNSFEVFYFIPEDFRREFPELGHAHGQPSDDEQNYDPHFWMSPLAVKSILLKLVETLVRVDPDGEPIYCANAGEFAGELDKLSAEVARKLGPYTGKAVLLFHPSFLYYLDEFGLEFAGVIEASPGREPSPKYVMDLIEEIRERNVKAIFTEPQLPYAPAKAIADEVGLPLVVIDPLGGYEGRRTYVELIRFNTGQFIKAFSGGD